jgi:hypothetical protein
MLHDSLGTSPYDRCKQYALAAGHEPVRCSCRCLSPCPAASVQQYASSETPMQMQITLGC